MVDFSKAVAKFVKETKLSSRKATTEIFRELTMTITFRTPIGDPTLWANPAPPGYIPGTLINSWFSTIGNITSSRPRTPDSFAKDTFADIDQIAPLVYGNVGYFVNPAPHAIPNEFGHSSQAPQGMVRLSVRNFPSITKRAVRKFK